MISLFQSVIAEIHQNRTWYYTRKFELLVKQMQHTAALLQPIPNCYLDDDFDFHTCEPDYRQGTSTYQAASKTIQKVLAAAQQSWQQHQEHKHHVPDHQDLAWVAWQGLFKRLQDFAFVRQVLSDYQQNGGERLFIKELKHLSP